MFMKSRIRVFDEGACRSRQSGEKFFKANGRPYEICSRCIMDTTDSNLSFDQNGICQYCANFDENILPNWRTDERGGEELFRLADKIRAQGKGREFDSIIGVSGGLDSSYTAYLAKEKLGLRPLLFHVD